MSVPSSSTSTFRDSRSTEVLDEGGYFDLDERSTPASDLRRDAPCSGWSSSPASRPSTPHHEVGPSQHEIDMRYADAQTMADHCMTYKITVKEYALKYGYQARPSRCPTRCWCSARTARACTPTNRCSATAATQLLRSGRPVQPLGHRQGVHRGPAAPRARDQLDLRPVGELIQAAGSRLRGSGLRRLVAAQPLGAGARPDVSPGARSTRPAWSCCDVLRTRRCNPYLTFAVLLHADLEGNRARLRAAGPDGEEPLPPLSRGSAPPWGSSSCT